MADSRELEEECRRREEYDAALRKILDYDRIDTEVKKTVLKKGNEVIAEGPGKRKLNLAYLTGLLAIFVVLTVVGSLLSISPPFIKAPQNCSDGTVHDECSSFRPYFCSDGSLISRASFCKCPEGYRANESDGCTAIPKCSDGTYEGGCSSDQPRICLDRELVDSAQKCGCPTDYRVKGDGCEKILKCGDGTLYDECSAEKPLYCQDGNLVNRSSFCGCGKDEVFDGEGCMSRYSTGPAERVLLYTLRGTTSGIKFTVHEGLDSYLANLTRLYYCTPDCPTQQDIEVKYLTEKQQGKELMKLADRIREITSDPEDRARIAISLVQKIPYDTDAVTAGNLTNRYPYEVLYDYKGVCGEKARLLSFLLKEFGFASSLLYYEKEEHMAVGLKCPFEYSQYNYNGTSYCFIETTKVSIPTDNTGEYADGSRLQTVPEVFVLSEGTTFSGLEEFRDRQEWLRLNELAARSGRVLPPDEYDKWQALVAKYGIDIKTAA